jgi:hypothetical protein
VPWVAAIRELYEQFEADSPQYRHNYWKGIFDCPAYQSFASPFDGARPGHEFVSMKRQIPTNEQGVIDRILSKSYIQVLPKKEQAELVDKIKAVLKKGDGLEWIDQTAGTFSAYPFWTFLSPDWLADYPYATDLCMLRMIERS